jgi:uncharacterized membrane protein
MSKGKHKKKPAAHHAAPSGTSHRGTVSPDRVTISLAMAGMLVTGYLTSVAWLGDNPALCAAGSGCDLIQQSRWSTVLGLPVALWGFAVYLLLALLAWRMPPRLKRWQRLWYVSLLGMAISIYLTIVGVVSIDAICPWCLASLAIISSIFLRQALSRPDSAPGMTWPNWLAQSTGAAIIVVALLHLWYAGLFAHPDTPRLNALAAHLEESGARFYGAWWCPACQAQKQEFGSAGDNLPFIECSTGGRGSAPTLHCRELGIQSYPTWIIDDRRYEGVLSPGELARHAGFPWD